MSSKHRFAARSKRRRLAVPFVTTLFLGATACTAANSTAPPAPAKPTPTHTSKKNTAEPPQLIPPLRPTRQGRTTATGGGGAGGQVGQGTWSRNPDLPKSYGHVTYNRDGTCFGTENFDCPKAVPGKPKPTCNPPPPRAVQCPTKPSPLEIADARKQSLTILAECAKIGTLPKTFSVEISAAGKCDTVYTIGNLEKNVLNCARDKLKKLGWPLHTAGYQIEIK